MQKRKFFEKYKEIKLFGKEVSAEIDMIYDYLGINPLEEIKKGRVSLAEEAAINNIIEKRISTNIPLQYITGFGYFMGEKYYVNEHTLIPRPETEILVTECIKLIKNDYKILDIGTGSGCIAIEIAKHTNANVDAVDISKEALSIAKKNAKKQDASCHFFKSDLFSNVNGKYDLIVSNPPYIPISDKNSLEKSVKDFEPHAALFANDEFGIEFYAKIINDAVTFLNDGGYLCFEIGYKQADRIIELLDFQGFSNIKVIKDLNNKERVTIAQHFLKNTFQ